MHAEGNVKPRTSAAGSVALAVGRAFGQGMWVIVRVTLAVVKK